MTAIERSEDYEGPALEWMLAQISRLRVALTESGVHDATIQRAVCERFFFGLASELDDVEIEPEPRPRRRLAFEHDGRLVLPDDDTFAFHDYALGVVGEAFGDA